MTIFTDISLEVRTKQNLDFYTQLKTCLTTAGFTVGELATIDSVINDVITAGDQPTIESDITESVNDSTAAATDLGQQNQAITKDSATQDKNKKLNVDYDPQDNKKAKTYPEASVISKKFTNTPGFPEASNDLTQDYPQTYGHIDKVGNWYKVNKKTKYMEIVHSSGSSLKINSKGDVSIRITGSLKMIIDDDSITNILGNKDETVAKNSSHQTIGQRIVKVGSTFKAIIGSTCSWMASKINLN